MNRILLWLPFLVACGGKSSDPSENEDLSIAEARFELEYVKRELAEGKDVVVKCMAARSSADKVTPGPEGKALADAIHRLCTYEAPLTMVDRYLARAESETDDIERAEPCSHVDLPLSTLEKAHGQEAQVRALRVRFRKLCRYSGDR